MYFWKTSLFDQAAEGTQGGGGAAGTGAGAGTGGDGKAADTTDYKALYESTKKEADGFKTRAEENEQSAKYWHEQAKGGGADKGGKPEEPADTTDVLELAAKGPAALKEWLRKEGFVSREEAESITNAKAQTIAREATVQAQYPELQDKESDFFKATAVEYGKLKQQGFSEIDAMEIGAQRAELAMLKSGKQRGSTTDEGKEKKTSGRGTEEERRARASAQQGDKGRPPVNRQDDDDELTPEQKNMCEKMGISEEAYKKRANDGSVQVGRR